MTRRIDISWKTIVFITIFLVLLWIVYQILDILLLFFVAFIIMSALSPIVDKLSSWRIPKIVAVILLFIVIIGTLVSLITVGLTPLITQTSKLSQQIIMTLDAILKANRIDQSVINQELSSLTGNAVDITLSIFENIIALVSLIVVSLYMVLDRQKVEHFATSFFATHQEKAQKILHKVEDKLGAWLRGQIVLSLLIGVAVYIGLTLFSIPYALPLAIIAGILEIVPVIGPIISAIPAIIIALTISPVSALIVLGLYIVIQQLEGHLVVPQVMKRAVGLNPLLVILAISVGGRLLGIGGALLAVPIAVVFQIIAEEVLQNTENPL